MLFASADIGSYLCSYDQIYNISLHHVWFCVLLKVTRADVACVGTFGFRDSVLFPLGKNMAMRKTRKNSEKPVF